MSTDQSTIDPRTAEALRNIKSGDAVERLVAWGRLERAGLATAIGAGRFVQFRLTDEGRALAHAIQ